jgi:Rrf2 family protein
MSLLPRKSVLALAAVIDIGITARPQPLSANALATRHRLPSRYLEPVLQRLVREGILDGKRGPQGGYILARDPPVITAGDILRVAGLLLEGEDQWNSESSPLLTKVVGPALAEAERAFLTALSRISLDDLMRLGVVCDSNEEAVDAIEETDGPLERQPSEHPHGD